MAIIQNITQFPPAPDSGTDSPQEFNYKANNFVAHQSGTYVGEVNQWATEANGLSSELNLIADAAEASAIAAEGSKDAAATSAALASNSADDAAAQVILAADQVGLAADQVGLAADQVTLATEQVGLAADQVGLAADQVDLAQLRTWEAEAWKMTANSYATEAYSVFVKVWSSNGAGGFTSVDTTEYSALHWKTEAQNVVDNIDPDSIIRDTDYGTETEGGIAKYRLEGTKLYITTDGSNP